MFLCFFVTCEMKVGYIDKNGLTPSAMQRCSNVAMVMHGMVTSWQSDIIVTATLLYGHKMVTPWRSPSDGGQIWSLLQRCRIYHKNKVAIESSRIIFCTPSRQLFSGSAPGLKGRVGQFRKKIKFLNLSCFEKNNILTFFIPKYQTGPALSTRQHFIL